MQEKIDLYNLTFENSHGILPRSDFAPFISTKERFPYNSFRSGGYLKKYSFLKNDIVYNSELFYGRKSDFEKFQGKKILVVAGGPTTNSHEWNPDEYDYIFSCNHFFLNDKLNKSKVELAIITNEVDLSSKKFLDYIKKNNTSIVLEDYNNDIQNIIDLSSEIDNQITECILRFQSKTGVGAKLIVLATLLGAKEIHFVGVDGPPKEGLDSQHSFEKGKLINALGSASPYPYELMYNHYRCLVRYLFNDIGKEVIYKNLGKGHDLNIISKILS